MHHSTNAPTLAERERFRKLEQLGCVVSRVYFRCFVPADLDHLVSGGIRVGHMATIPLREWYHRGVPPFSKFKKRPLTQKEARRILGPSRALEPLAFRERFGPNEELLEMTNQLIEVMP